ncbi:BamA/OMP85 family outer membrane protein [Blattabacterium cuenoti]|uniref:BamA/OMP85 family outer membrane protein n=1 Tax=Blattabacterium cuenoti TaxID=1653831 RepID=UPI00163BA83F|nr:POTRA domain-containing protein [Blattabacterium cuenoti]
MEKLNKRSRNILLYLFIIFFPSLSFSITENWNEMNKNEKTSTFTVRNIYVIGKTKYDHHFISDFFNIFPGDKIFLPGKKVDETIRKLWKKNLFKKISVYKKNRSKNEIDLFFNLEDLPEIHKINIEGSGIELHKFPIIEKIKSGDKISEDIIQNIRNEIINFYIQKGYYEISITNVIKVDNHKNILNLHINKGKKIEINNIFFHGNHYLTDNALLRIMEKTRKKNFFSCFSIRKKFVYIYENIKEDLKNIKYKYISMGFLDAKAILDSVCKNDNDNYFKLKIKIIEGKKYYLDDVNFVGNTVVKTDILKKILSYKKGDIYNKIGIENNIFDIEKKTSKNNITSYYLNLGFLLVKIVPIERLIDDNKISLEIQIKENKPVFINKVHIVGNTLTKDHVIRRELNTYPGDLFSPIKIKNSLFRLENLNLFDNKKTYPYLQLNNDNTLDVEWRISEKNTNQIQLNGGYGKDKFLGNFQLNIGNFSISDLFRMKSWKPIPQGDGQNLILSFQFGKNTQSYGLSFTEPWFSIIDKVNPTSLTLNMNYSNNKKKTDDLFLLYKTFSHENITNIEGFLKKKEFSINLNKPLFFIDSYSKIMLSIDYNQFYYDHHLFPNLNNGNGLKINNLNYLIAFQRFSNYPDFIFPITGSKIQFESKFTLPYSTISMFFKIKKDKNIKKSLSEWMEFFKVKITYSLYKEILNKTVLKIGEELGVIGKYSINKKLFHFQKFSMGGIKNDLFSKKKIEEDHISLRGYSNIGNDSITPGDGGIIYNKSVFEIRYLIKEYANVCKFWILSFIEGGSISDSYKKFNPLKMNNKSFGFGFRLFWLPIGPFGIDVGYPIVGKSSFYEKEKYKIHFIIGQN